MSPSAAASRAAAARRASECERATGPSRTVLVAIEVGAGLLKLAEPEQHLDRVRPHRMRSGRCSQGRTVGPVARRMYSPAVGRLPRASSSRPSAPRLRISHSWSPSSREIATPCSAEARASCDPAKIHLEQRPEAGGERHAMGRPHLVPELERQRRSLERRIPSDRRANRFCLGCGAARPEAPRCPTSPRRPPAPRGSRARDRALPSRSAFGPATPAGSGCTPAGYARLSSSSTPRSSSPGVMSAARVSTVATCAIATVRSVGSPTCSAVRSAARASRSAASMSASNR